jgi:hypothetical protein
MSVAEDVRLLDPLVEPNPAVEARLVVIRDGATKAGAVWATGCCTSMRDEGRRIEGGFPGTLGEARVRLLSHVAVDLQRRRLPALLIDEVAWAARLTYREAKREWREHQK